MPLGEVEKVLEEMPAPLSVGLVTSGEGSEPIKKKGMLVAGLNVPVVPLAEGVLPKGSGGEEVPDGGLAWPPGKAPELAGGVGMPLGEVDKPLCEVGAGGGKLGTALKGVGDEVVGVALDGVGNGAVGAALEGVAAVGVAPKGAGYREAGVALEETGASLKDAEEERLGLLLVTEMSAGVGKGLVVRDGAVPVALGGDATIPAAGESRGG